ncbi:hypothetical protein [Nocardioides sp. SYSU D00038]|uniref:hypothetical protein n=1 Tax=Nocardioides sp. SYSU D00038 TaxID=2812554 RepID=UPI00196892D4|nr:hypothetical protein [Nocardioides sp. SYSU D00038]
MSDAPVPRSGPHQVLVVVYLVFAVAAGARSAVQLATRAGEAPFAYALSAASAVTYVLGWWAIRRAVAGRPAFARVMLWVELAGVLVVGTLSLVERDWFGDQTVWTWYGAYYGLLPLVLPVLGLVWLARTFPRTGTGSRLTG